MICDINQQYQQDGLEDEDVPRLPMGPAITLISQSLMEMQSADPRKLASLLRGTT